jgi:transposase
LLPPRPPRRRRYPGRLPVDGRAALRRIVYVLCKGVSWADVPKETIGCSGVTCWRRLRDWTGAGLWPRLHALLPAELRAAGLLDMDDTAIDGSHVRALKRGTHRTFAGRPCPAGQQAPPDHRPARDTVGCLADKRKPSRRHADDAVAGRDTPHPRNSRTAASAASPAVRRPRLRLQQVPTPPASARHHGESLQRRSPSRVTISIVTHSTSACGTSSTAR